ncbi:c6 transcription factor [Fusarium flagelliforme]|uniref:C6 transcription factor n=1 Tax=Fusarium flagelliforme TaxID=2675880 RepID=A0A395N2Z3_9HYPO|nr:c6 transcription factor [Fusarium flagelliforme]
MPETNVSIDKQNAGLSVLGMASKVSELEARLAAASQNSDPADANASEGIYINLSDAVVSPPLLGSNHETEMQRDKAAAESSDKAESRIDVLAAGVFDHPSSGSSICYFGSSSNHALFWSLTASIANLGHRSSRLHQESLRAVQAHTGPARIPHPASSSIGHYGSVDEFDIVNTPGRDEAMNLISRFFDTVGALLPYVNQSALVASFDKISGPSESQSESSNRAVKALRSIIFAHALSTRDAAAAEPFYRGTLSLLDPKTLYTPCLELLQTLLLLSIFQQNSQRSTESWTTHSLAVKASYQLGIHAPSSYDHLTASEKELRSGLWFATVNQDRILSSALGQPCMIPLQHVRSGILDMLVSTRQQRTVEMQYSREHLEYFRNIVILHGIMGIVLESICGSNIDPSSSIKTDELLGKTLELSLRLEKWRGSTSPRSILEADVSFSSWTESDIEEQRNSILLSIFYYRTVLLVHGCLLMSILEVATRKDQQAVSGVLKNTAASLLKDDLVATNNFCHLIRGLLASSPTFFKSNAIWWTCNYAALTISLHTFAFWLASTNPETEFIACGISSFELEVRLRGCLDMLRVIGTSSAMSVKAHRCLQRHLDFLIISTRIPFPTDPGSDAPRIPHAGTRAQEPGPASGEVHDDLMASVSDDPTAGLFSDLNVLTFGNAEFDDLDLLGITDFDATGLI